MTPDPTTAPRCATEGQIIASLYAWIGHQAITAIPRYRPDGWFECDLYLVTKSLYAVEYEVKRTLADYKKDTCKGTRPRLGHAIQFRRSTKHEILSQPHPLTPNRFYFVVPRGLLAKQPVPDWAGVIEFDPHPTTLSSCAGVISRRYIVPHATKRAPLLHKERISRERVAAINEALGYRFWNNVKRCGSITAPKRTE